MTFTTPTGWSVSSRPSLVRLVGEIDLDSAPRLRRALRRAAPEATSELVVDLSGVTFMDCSGLGELLDARAHLGGGLHLRGVPQRVRDLLRLAGLDGVFDIADDVAAETPDGPRARGDASEQAVPVPEQPQAHPSAPSADAPPRILEAEERVAGRRAAASGRARVDQAKGLVMATRGCDAEEAWRRLFRASRDQDVQVHDLADALIRVAAGRDMGQSGAAMMAAVRAVMSVGTAVDEHPRQEAAAGERLSNQTQTQVLPPP